MKHRRDTRSDPQSRVVAVLTLALVALALWRVRQGVDLGDGAHVVAIAVRLAEGDVPLADELNLQSLGSLAAVPFTWVWLQLVGLEGVVLASRTFYLALALGAGALGYAALRTGFRPLPAFVAVVLACTPTPYNLLVTSYNTVPGLALGVATFTGYAAVARRSGRWAAVAGVALAVAVVSHPSALPGAAVLGLLLLVLLLRRGGPARGLLIGGGAASAVVVLAILLGPGLGALLTTVAYTTDYQSARPDPLVRLARTAEDFLQAMTSLPYLPVLALALIASTGRVPARGRAVAAVLVPVAAALPAVARVEAPVQVGGTSGSYAVMVALVLLVPVLLWAGRGGDRDLLLLLALAAPGLVGLLVYASLTTAAARWGAVVPPVVPLLGVVGLGVVAMVADARGEPWTRGEPLARVPATVERSPHGVGVATLVATALVTTSLLGTHALRSFRDPAPWIATLRVDEGPNAGLRTSPEMRYEECAWRLLFDAWVAPGEGLLAYGMPAAYLYTDGPTDSAIVWLGDFGAANQDVVDWLDRTGRWPDVVAVQRPVGTEWEEKSTTDPLLARLAAEYGPLTYTGQFYVLRRDGSTEPPRPLGDVTPCRVS
ncbi:hypothetical protein [Ornithinimicrobium cerasi]|uniref:hypothetical protein n=1 Tax=Ornithinimicrobium cerasi TaxID=2248773 RepID=UPI000F005E92|nr:hypothetical protein [Ornithinimicrobium cerasi]